MGLRGNALRRFGRRVEEVLEEVFSGVLVVGGARLVASCAGGREGRGWTEDGLEEVRRERVVRVAKAELPVAPPVGSRVVWEPDGGTPVALRVQEVPEHNHESRWRIRCYEV